MRPTGVEIRHLAFLPSFTTRPLWEPVGDSLAHIRARSNESSMIPKPSRRLMAYSPKCLEVEFSQVRGSKLPAPSCQNGAQAKLCLQFGDKPAHAATKVPRVRSKWLQLATTELLENFGNLLGCAARDSPKRPTAKCTRQACPWTSPIPKKALVVPLGVELPGVEHVR